jgi:glucose/arabinose dehydrogenase
MCLGACAAACALTLAAPARGGTVPAGFDERTVISGLELPMAIAFAPDGRVFVGEKSGIVKVFDGLDDPTPTVFADLRTRVHDFLDRGLMGIAVSPDYPEDPALYVSYAHDAAIGGTAPRWGDDCPDPPGAETHGCVISGRVSRLIPPVGAGLASEQVVIENWCQQFPSHSVGAVEFDAQGRLYVAGGEGASYTTLDWGQFGQPPNPCGDPPTGYGTALGPPTAEGGALRAQDLEEAGDPVGLSGTIIRIDPTTGAGVSGNPLFASSSANARRIVAYGFRNPFRFAVSPGGEVWVGDVGWYAWEEINRFQVGGSEPPNFGWPCYEGDAPHPSYAGADLDICEDLYDAPTADRAPHHTYRHTAPVVPGEACSSGSSSISGMELAAGADFPAAYDGALFFADYSRNCIWVMQAGAGGSPHPSHIATFDAGASMPVDLEVGPDGALYYVDIGGTVNRIAHETGNRRPVAVAAADPSAGSVPLTVEFDATGSSDADGDDLAYAWDLDGDGEFDDSTQAAPERTYTEPGDVSVGLRVDDGLDSDTDTVTVSAGNDPPAVSIESPRSDLRWRVGETIELEGSATDPQDGELPSAAFDWDVILDHCPSNCHEHVLQRFDATAAASFAAPDHEYPSNLELRLTATDSGELTDTAVMELDPATVKLLLDSSPAGLALNLNALEVRTPFDATVIEGSQNTIGAPSPQVMNGAQYDWAGWSDGGARSHTVSVPADSTYTATFDSPGPVAPPGPEVETLKVKRPETVRGLLGRGVMAKVGCDTACEAKVTARAHGRRARKLALSGTIAKGRRALAGGATAWVVAEVTKRAERKLKDAAPGSSPPRLRVRVRAVG